MNSQADFERYEREVKLSDDKHPLSERDKAILNALKNKPAPLTGRHFNGLICDDLISDYGTTGKPAVMDKESLRASIKYFNEMMGNNKALRGHYKTQLLSTMVVDPAAKNKNKEKKMDNEKSADAPASMGQGRVPWSEPQQGFVRRYDVMIGQVENGFIIKVGCKTFVSMDWKEASKALGEYFKDPIAAEKEYSRKEK